jgi:hypothetical protein
MNTKCCVAWIVLAVIAHGGSASGQEPFRRVLFESAVPLGEEAPTVAMQGDRVAFGAGHEIKVFDVRRQEMIFTQSLVPGALSPSLAYEARVLGIFSNTVYACVRHFADPDRLDPGGKWGAVGGGADPGEFEVVAVRIGEKEIRPIAHLAAEVTLAEGLRGTTLPFVEGDSLRLLSLETGAIRDLSLPGPAINRPVVKDGELVGRYEGGAYVLGASDAALRCIPFANTPLAQLAEQAPFAKCGDLLVGFVENQVVACGLDGQLRWRTPIIAGEITGSREHVLILRPGVDEWPTLCRLDPKNGVLTWRRPVSPRVNLSGNNRLYGVEVFGGRIVFFNEREISVFDCATGRFLVNLPQNRTLVRRSYPMTAKLVRMALAGDRLAIGFENAVVAVHITPTSEVGEAFRGSDPANARRGVETLVEAESKASDTIEQIAAIGHNLADTPEIAPVIRSWLRGVLSSHSREEELDALVRAFYWFDDDALLAAAAGVLGGKIHEGDKMCMVNILACHPVPEKGLAVLRQVAAGGAAYSVAVRGEASKWLRLCGEKAEMRPEDLALLYSGDHDATVAAFSRRLRETEAGGRAALLKLIGMATDAVIVALADDLERLSEGERENGLKLVSEARTRLEAMSRMRERE